MRIKKGGSKPGLRESYEPNCVLLSCLIQYSMMLRGMPESDQYSVQNSALHVALNHNSVRATTSFIFFFLVDNPMVDVYLRQGQPNNASISYWMPRLFAPALWTC
jgi:hypothetical protein